MSLRSTLSLCGLRDLDFVWGDRSLLGDLEPRSDTGDLLLPGGGGGGEVRNSLSGRGEPIS